MSTCEKQENPMKVEPRKEHAWLRRIVGEWAFEGECSMGPGQPAATFSGTESVRALGDVWVVGEGKGEMPGGGDSRTLITLGFDTKTERFVGTFVCSMMTNLWIYDGWLDADGRTLTLEADGPDMAGSGATVTYRDIVVLESDDSRVMRSQVRGEDGEWHDFMTSRYRRTA